MIRPIYFEGDDVVILDQTRLPHEVIYERIETAEQAALAIKMLKVRGAPLIGVSAAFALTQSVNKYDGTAEGLDAHFEESKKILAASRPTAVNLFWALDRMEKVYRENKEKPLADIKSILKAESEKMCREDIEANKAMGDFGQELLEPCSRILTICNTGTLASCWYGTALGVIRSAAEKGKIQMVYACETRPLLQGARLTVWELMQDKIPVTLITDSMAGHTMKHKKIDAVIAGADRIAANGDTANKIGTFTLAVLADYYKIPFYIAAPMSTVDTGLPSGEFIPIEERDPEEVRRIRGNYITVPDVEVYSPAFDVTPHELITAVITEKGVIRPPYAFK